MRSLRNIIVILAAAAAISAQVKVPPLNIVERKLPNGLTVVSLRDNSSPTVAIHVLYDVGGKNDPPGKSGFAHMFEHMMFKSTKNMPNEKMDRLTEDVGGFNNASTWDDFTNYYEVVPSNYLETLLWAEAERMSNLNVDEANFASERDVVKEEFRQSVLAQPYGRFYEYISSLSYKVHPYKRGVIGDLDQLNAATVDDARAFHSLYYRPDNAYLIVVGDFQQAQFDAWVDKYFGVIKQPRSFIPRVTEVEPPRTKEERYAKTAPNVPFPGVAITYLGPRSNDPDIPALQVAEAILARGDSSRLYQSLVYKQQIAQEASFNVDNKVEGGLLYFFAIASEGKTADELERSLLAELKLIQDKGVTAAEVTKAKNLLVASQVRRLENNDGKAIAIERALAYQKDARAVNTGLAKIQAVTAADVQRVMKKYFSDTNRVVIHYSNDGGSK
ncbi:MAG: insulinase family protein [Acidobacteria bacterium]|nr:insulinase family protein [Acidobacteriota bacterium]MCW5950617.1 insulinase family protein [Pyrinomonadaceae bacterium]